MEKCAMRIWEVFEEYRSIIEGADEIISAAKQSMVSAKRQEKHGQIEKLKDKVSQKQSELSKITSPIKTINQIKPISHKEVQDKTRNY